jgi:hypothetical protein
MVDVYFLGPSSVLPNPNLCWLCFGAKVYEWHVLKFSTGIVVVSYKKVALQAHRMFYH